MKNGGISPVLTKKELETERNLIKELNKRKEFGDRTWLIRGCFLVDKNI